MYDTNLRECFPRKHLTYYKSNYKRLYDKKFGELVTKLS